MVDLRKTFPKWLLELKRFQALKSVFFLHGNVYDCYYFPTNFKDASRPDDLTYAKFNNSNDLLKQYLLSQGYEVLTYFDVIDGMSIESNDKFIDRGNIVKELSLTPDMAASYLSKAITGKKDDAISFHRELMRNNVKLCASIVNFTSRFTSNPNALEEDSKPLFIKMIKAAQESRVFPDKNGLRNILIFICDKLNDIPAWMLLENPLTKGIELQKPDREERTRFFEQRRRHFYSVGSEPDFTESMKIFPDLTDNFSNRELENLITISKQEQIHVNKIREIIDLYKYGIRENPWEKIETNKIEHAETILRKRVMGQDQSIKKAVEIIRRSNLGLDSIDKIRPSSKPKGVLFLAGPTGTGKTELAKALAELIFSDEEAMIRFDMSEYNDSNSDVKLIGSPPGYVGYEDGGQLTDAIRKKPFSIVLFDEIEKAHPKIFDKFLQILDDGRLTDGKGETAYFSQTLILFTSNLGIYKEDGRGGKVRNVEFSDDYSTMEKKIKDEIKGFFGGSLGRPEIFNRFGDNFVVFDYIRPEIAQRIVKKNLQIIQENLVKLKNVVLEHDEDFVQNFVDTFAQDNLDMGGRGLVNRLETYIKNGLTNFMFQSKKIADCTIRMEINSNNVLFS